MQLNNLIMRVFEVRPKPGKAALLKQKLSDTSVAVVNGKPGNVGYLFGAAMPFEDNNLVFISVWKDLESIRRQFGEDWKASFLPDGYEELIDCCSIRHIEVSGILDSPVTARDV